MVSSILSQKRSKKFDFTKSFFQADDSSKKWSNEFRFFLPNSTKNEIVRSFFGQLKTPKRHFEINLTFKPHATTRPVYFWSCIFQYFRLSYSEYCKHIKITKISGDIVRSDRNLNATTKQLFTPLCAEFADLVSQVRCFHFESEILQIWRIRLCSVLLEIWEALKWCNFNLKKLKIVFVKDFLFGYLNPRYFLNDILKNIWH